MHGSGKAGGAAPVAATTYPRSRHGKPPGGGDGTIMLNATQLTFHPSGKGGTTLTVPWADVAKHQVSPATHSKCLLKLVPVVGTATAAAAGPRGLTFGVVNGAELERIRRDVTGRLAVSRKSGARSTTAAPAPTTPAAAAGKKRSLSAAHAGSLNGPASPPPMGGGGGDGGAKRPMHSSFTDLDTDALAVTRSSLLSSNPTLRAQHRLLVTETQTLTEEDFWSTHTQSLADEYARISGKVKAGQSSAMRSNLDLGPRGRVRLGVEEMRQIFVLYPAVHRAYEEKVPLELSEEQFWRKYLESEYFHRDRGRIGNHVGRANKRELKEKEKMDKATGVGGGDDKGKKDDDDHDEAGARMAAAGTNDIFSRLESEMKGAAALAGGKGGKASASSSSKLNGCGKIGNRLAVGQFDLAATAETERGGRLLTATDLYPPPPDDTVAGRVVDKYNRHWAMVLNPDDATAGANLLSVARSSVDSVLEGDDDAKVGGGVDREMERLVGYANAHEDDADHVKGIGDGGDGDGGAFLSLELQNVRAYTGELIGGDASAMDGAARKQEERRRAVFSRAMADGAKKMAASTRPGRGGGDNGNHDRLPASFEHSLPDARLGQELLKALTNKMAADSRTEADAARLAASLPEDFRARLNRYFRRSSELLRHFFALRDLVESSPGGGVGGGKEKEEYECKMARIVKGMESVYREMEEVRKEQPQTEQGEIMRKMCLPVMDQLDWAFKLHRDGSEGGGGGFVTVEEL